MVERGDEVATLSSVGRILRTQSRGDVYAGKRRRNKSQRLKTLQAHSVLCPNQEEDARRVPC